MTKFSYNMSFEDIDKGILTLGKRAKTLREDLHKMCVSLFVRWHDKGDVRVVVKAAEKITKEVEKYYGQALVDWFSAFGALEWSNDSGYSYKETRITLDAVKAAKDKPFWIFSPPKAPKPFDLMVEFQKLLEKADKHMKKPKPEDVVPPSLRSAVAAAISEWKQTNEKVA